MRREKKEKDRGTEGETPNPITGNWWANRGWRAEWKTEENKKKETWSGSPTHLSWMRRDHTVSLFFLPSQPTWRKKNCTKKIHPILFQKESTIYHSLILKEICSFIWCFYFLQKTVNNSKPFPYVFEDFQNWMNEEVGLCRKFLFVTCGDWDLKDMLPSQCEREGIVLPDYMKTWMNIKKVCWCLKIIF